MKKTVLTIVLSVICIGNVSAQKWLKGIGKVIDKAEQVIQGDSKKTATTSSHPDSNNQSNKADYTLAEVLQVENSVVATPVDLGLSVKWASKNLGAAQPFQYGGYYDRKADYIKQYWGGGWRLPTEKEWEELFTKCKVKYVTAVLRGKEYMPDIAGYLLITGPNGNKIWLPAAGFKNKPADERHSNGHGTEGFYWAYETGKDEAGSTVYNRIFFRHADEKFNYYPEKFSVWGGASIRPVYIGKEESQDNVPANVFSGVWELVSPDGSREVAIELTPEGKKDEFSETILYGTINTVLTSSLRMDDDIIIGFTVKGNTAYLEYECGRTGEKGKALLIYNSAAQTIALKVTEYPKAEYDGCYAEDCIFKKIR